MNQLIKQSILHLLAPRNQINTMSNLQFGANSLCSDGSICSDVSNTFGYQLDCFPDNSLSFLGNNHDEANRNDPLYYNWTDINNYEDVGDMYRSSDSTCGISTTHGDGLDWFSFSDAVGGAEDAPNVPCFDSRSRKRMFENDDTSRLDCMTHSSSVSDFQEASATYKGSSLQSIKHEEQRQLDSSARNGSSCFLPDDNSSHLDLLSSKDSSCHGEQNKKLRCQNQSGLRRNELSENDAFFNFEDILRSDQLPAQTHDSKPFGFLQGDTPYKSSFYSTSSDITSLHQSIKGSTETLLPVVSSAPGDTRDQMYRNQGFKASSNDNPKNVNLASQMSMSTTISNETPAHSPTKNECNSGVNVGLFAKSDSSGRQGNSENFKFDDISAGATSFRQLQLVMNQLDSRTKLCIKDSLYRLAWNAGQRHCYESLESGFIDDRYSTLSEGRKMNMEMETDTNPMDRSIAHLLFHRSADQSVLAG